MSVSLLLGIVIGIVLGLTGAGGGILAVPALVAGMGWSMQQAAPVALIAVAGSAAVGAIEALQRGLVRYRAALWMTLAGVPFTVFGNMIARELSQRWLMSAFAVVMLLAAFRLLRREYPGTSHESGRLSPHICRLNPETGRFDWTGPTLLLVGAIGAVAGLMTGLLGVGGGFIIVPMLRRFTDVSIHGIVATSLLVIALVGFGGVGVALLHGAVLPYPFCLLFAVATACGMLVGRAFSRHLPAHRVQQGFSAVLVCAALALLVKAAMGVA